MFFRICENVFRRFPDYCVGVVGVKHGSNGVSNDHSRFLLQESVKWCASSLGSGDPRNHPAIHVWREAFKSAGINPNRFPSSIEALTRRIWKGGVVPPVNIGVDLANSAALRYLVPVGCHDMGRLVGDFEVREAQEGEPFHPMGGGEVERVGAGEPVYVDSLEVRTRRWVWRQGENAKVLEDTCDIFFPVDGFHSCTFEGVRQARDFLAEKVVEYLGGEVFKGFLDRHTREMQIP